MVSIKDCAVFGKVKVTVFSPKSAANVSTNVVSMDPMAKAETVTGVEPGMVELR